MVKPSPSDAPERVSYRSSSRPSSFPAWRSGSAVKPMVDPVDDTVISTFPRVRRLGRGKKPDLEWPSIRWARYSRRSARIAASRFKSGRVRHRDAARVRRRSPGKRLPPPDEPEAVVFAGDGQEFSKWGRLLETADVPSTMIVGVHGLSEEMPRLREYSPVFDADRFAAHEEFFVEDVRRWVRVAFWSRAARRTHRGVRLLGWRRARARAWASPSRRLRCGLLWLARRGLQTAWRNAEFASAGVPFRRHAGAVLPRQREPMGSRSARGRCGRRDE